MAKYKETEKGQGFFLPVNLSEQVLLGTFEWTMSHFIDTQVDYSGFDLQYNNDATGASAIHPGIMLKAVFCGYSKGQYSSRKLQDMCENNITMKALTGDTEPYFTTIARFMSTNEEEIKKIFTEVLYFCNELGLIAGKMFAVDGCKLPSNASKEWSGTKKELKKKKEKTEKLVEKLMKLHAEEEKKVGGKDKSQEEEAKFAEQIKRYRNFKHNKRSNSYTCPHGKKLKFRREGETEQQRRLPL